MIFGIFTVTVNRAHFSEYSGEVFHPDPCVRLGRNLKFETVRAVNAATAFALSRLLSGGGEAFVAGRAGPHLGGVPAPGLRAVGAALVVAVQ